VLRRPISDEPVSRLAAWSSRFGWLALVMAALSIIVLRSDLLEIVPALVTFGGALALASLAILLSFGAAIVIWRQGNAGIGRAVTGLFLGLLLLGYPAYHAYLYYKLPQIRDITTDFTNPPRFEVIGRLRPRGTSDYPGAPAAALQRRFYSDIAPLQVQSPPKTAFDATLNIVNKRKWRVVDARPPAPPARRDGVIEAVARTPIMGFRDDVVIRIVPLGAGAQVDVRSASRFGNHDFGSNASRVRALLEEIDDAAGELPAERADPKRPPARQPAKR
jgi:uncharacterized protein (DUF1499 family)